MSEGENYYSSDSDSSAHAHSDAHSEDELVETKTTKKVHKTVNPKTEGDYKKLSTKDMIEKALADINTRKGASLYAIKKYIAENFKVNTERNNTIIKKQLKGSVEAGNIKQIKGIGASGSFKLIINKEDKKKTEKKAKLPKQNEKQIKKPNNIKAKKTTEKTKVKEPKVQKGTGEKKVRIVAKKVKETSNNVTKESNKKKQRKNDKMAALPETPKNPAKKKSSKSLKRKSIGSIIKTPKMKPKNRA